VQSRKPTGQLPRISNRLTDIEIPRSAWSTWREEGKSCQLRRALTSDEIAALETRRDELAPFVAPFAMSEIDKVSLALADMFNGFRSMRQSGDEAVAIIESAVRLLAEFPAWAIEKACLSIRKNGVWRDGRFDRQWPPSDAELVGDVRKEVRFYSDQHRSAAALLDATVEDPS
jgi:hypothetical protein